MSDLQQGRGHPPLFRHMVAERYDPRDDDPETFAVRAFMRGFAYGVLLEESIAYRPPRRRRTSNNPFGRAYDLTEHSDEL